MEWIALFLYVYFARLALGAKSAFVNKSFELEVISGYAMALVWPFFILFGLLN